MQLSDVFIGLGQDAFAQLLRTISLGKLKTFQLYDRMKARLHLLKLNAENIRKSAPKFWLRLEQRDDEFATELAQAVLVSNISMIKAVLDELAIPHDDGFFAKDLDASKHLTDGWQQRVYDKFRSVYPESLLLFYINHLALQVA